MGAQEEWREMGGTAEGAQEEWREMGEQLKMGGHSTVGGEMWGAVGGARDGEHSSSTSYCSARVDLMRFDGE